MRISTGLYEQHIEWSYAHCGVVLFHVVLSHAQLWAQRSRWTALASKRDKLACMSLLVVALQQYSLRIRLKNKNPRDKSSRSNMMWNRSRNAGWRGMCPNWKIFQGSRSCVFIDNTYSVPSLTLEETVAFLGMQKIWSSIWRVKWVGVFPGLRKLTKC